LAAAELTHREVSAEQESAATAIAELKAAERQILDRVEKARKHIEVATQEVTLEEVKPRYIEACNAVTAAKNRQTNLECSLSAVKDAESWWLPFQQSVHAIQAAERELWLAGEGLRMLRQVKEVATDTKTLADAVADAVAKLPTPKPELVRHILVATGKVYHDVQKELLEARAHRPLAGSEHCAHFIGLLCALYSSDEQLSKVLNELPAKLCAFDKADIDPAGALAQAEYKAAGQRQKEAGMKIKEFNKAIVESNKRLAAQQETMTELEEIWELAKARLELQRLIPTPSC
jgi:hypothetical protein